MNRCDLYTNLHCEAKKVVFFRFGRFKNIFLSEKTIFQVSDPADSCDDSIALARPGATLEGLLTSVREWLRTVRFVMKVVPVVWVRSEETTTA